MGRNSDPALEGRILNAAKELWSQGGEDALSMRAIAEAAGTNTPAMYRRFRTRDEILRAVVMGYQQQLFKRIERCKSVSSVVDCIVDYALECPQEYRLMTSGLLARVTSERPNFYFVADRCAEWMGGKAAEYEGLVLTIFSMAYGLALLTISNMIPAKERARARSITRTSLDALLGNMEMLRGL